MCGNESNDNNNNNNNKNHQISPMSKGNQLKAAEVEMRRQNILTGNHHPDGSKGRSNGPLGGGQRHQHPPRRHSLKVQAEFQKLPVAGNRRKKKKQREEEEEKKRKIW